jgi:hypothetical protein
MAVADIGLRDLGAIIPGKSFAGPDGSPFALAAADKNGREEPAAPSVPVFAADLPDGRDALGVTGHLAILCELVLHADAETPLTIGLLGPPGCGKSYALTKLIRLIEALSARAAGGAGWPFISEIIVPRVDAAGLAGNPFTALAGALYTALSSAAPDIAADAARAARDPRADASEMLERLYAARRKLEAERRALDETNASRARLPETLLDQIGTQIDIYVRANEARIRKLLSKARIAGDPVSAFKDMAGALADAEGFGQRAGFMLRAFAGFKGQRRLAGKAILLLMLGLALGLAAGGDTDWLRSLRAWPSSASIAEWLDAHSDLLANLRATAFAGGAALLALCGWRAFALYKLVSRGAALLQGDLAARRRDMDSLCAHQSRHVEALAAEVEALGRLAAEAERRAGAAGPAALGPAQPLPFPVDIAAQQAQAFVAAAGSLIAKPRQSGSGRNGPKKPRRIVVAVDHLDSVPASRAREILDAGRLLFQEGYAVLVAACPARLGCAQEEGAANLSRWIDVPFQVGEIASRAGCPAFVESLLSGGPAGDLPVWDAGASALDAPLSAKEAQLLSGLAPLAGSTARAMKRFVNLYRLARGQDLEHTGALAFMLALHAGGTPAEIAAVSGVLASADAGADLKLDGCSSRLIDALALARSTQGRISVVSARRAAAAARVFSFGS